MKKFRANNIAKDFFANMFARGIIYNSIFENIPDTYPTQTLDVEIRLGGNHEPVIQHGVIAPSHWSKQAVEIVANLYFRGHVGTSEREDSVFDMIDRVVGALNQKMSEFNYFCDDESRRAFIKDIRHALIMQYFSYNSPVWFNLGAESDPQCSACFILSVDDSLHGISKWYNDEMNIFSGGSGSGVNLSKIRHDGAEISGSGNASGPISFMKPADAGAAAIKSGGKTRRAAKMVILNDRHPDILEFIRFKMLEEKKAHHLIDAGIPAKEAYATVGGQNANNSVRVSDWFMTSAENDLLFNTRDQQDNTVRSFSAKTLLHEMAVAAHACGCPGLQFDDTINDWNTARSVDTINASNPCSEYMFLDDSACNLASINLLAVFKDYGKSEFYPFLKKLAKLITISMDAIVDISVYPTQEIANNSHNYRPLGLGFANLGGLLLHKDTAYSDPEGRDIAQKCMASIFLGSLEASAIMSRDLNPMPAWGEVEWSHLEVVRKHGRALDPSSDDASYFSAILELIQKYGLRNAQHTVLAPTGSISFMMDCDTTGIEPLFALVSYKKLENGGLMKITSPAVDMYLARSLGDEALEKARLFIQENGHAQGCPGLTEHQQKVLLTASTAPGILALKADDHLLMMAACQPFVSGAISKTVNCPEDTTVEEIERIFMLSWKLGLKAVAVYRDNCKRYQPLNLKKDEPKKSEHTLVPERNKLPITRQGSTHKINIPGLEAYLTVNYYENGKPAEVFLKAAKQGTTINGLLDALSISISLGLQYGVPCEVIAEKFTGMFFEPQGFTGNPDIPLAKSICDYIGRYLSQLTGEKETVQNILPQEAPILVGVTCAHCGSDEMKQAGSCKVCAKCGTTTGCS